jgi:diguanylate cyclase (GGDEF)-like protein
VARWGGEEFLVITRQSRRADAGPLAERIRQTIEQEPFQLPGGQSLRKTVSIGYCHYPFFSGDAEKLGWHQVVALADSALYLAKHNGRNLVVGVQPGQTPAAGDGQKLLADLAQAAERGHIEVLCRRPVRFPPHP